MTVPKPVQIEILFRRQRIDVLIAFGLTLLALILVFAILPLRKHALELTISKLHAIESKTVMAPPKDAQENNSERLVDFQKMLGARMESERHIKTLYSLARDKQLTIRKAEYKADFNKNGNYHVYRVTIPFQAGYDAVRAFCDAALRSIPFASIDSVQFNRNSVDAGAVEAKVTLTFYLNDKKADIPSANPVDSPAAPHAASSAIPTGAVIN